MAENTVREAQSQHLPRILPAGDGALVVEFGSTVNEAVNDTVMAFDSAVSAAGIDGIVETVPTYRSLQVVYDPLTIRAAS